MHKCVSSHQFVATKSIFTFVGWHYALWHLYHIPVYLVYMKCQLYFNYCINLGLIWIHPCQVPTLEESSRTVLEELLDSSFDDVASLSHSSLQADSDQMQFYRLFETSDKTRLLTLSSNNHTSAWPKAPPITNLGLSIPTVEFHCCHQNLAGYSTTTVSLWNSHWHQWDHHLAVATAPFEYDDIML